MSVRDNNDPRRKLVITDFDALLRMLIKDGTARNTGSSRDCLHACNNYIAKLI